MKVINSFTDDYAFLSNFYPSIVISNDIRYPTVEHYYQASKTLDVSTRYAISQITGPGRAKIAGHNVVLRPDWETVKVYIMFRGLMQKFLDAELNPGLQEKLLATEGYKLVEGNYWHDNVWGVCSCNKKITCIQAQPGKNYLGILLMDVRSIIRMTVG